MKIMLSIVLILSIHIQANQIKEAFSEGLKASVKVILHEKAQAKQAIPDGYCLSLTAKGRDIDPWEEIKFESLALVLGYTPALFAEKNTKENPKRLLCLNIDKNRDKALESLNAIAKVYPALSTYHARVKLLDKNVRLVRVIPVIGELQKSSKSKEDFVPPKTIFLGTSMDNKDVIYKSGNIHVIKSEIEDVLFITHTLAKDENL